MLKNGIILVKFDMVNGRDEVIQGGVIYFDKKFVIIKEYFLDIEFIKDKFINVFVWIKLYGLDDKYWSVIGLSKIGSFLGKFMMLYDNILKKVGINFLRIFVEIEINYNLKDQVFFKNENGVLIE